MDFKKEDNHREDQFTINFKYFISHLKANYISITVQCSLPNFVFAAYFISKQRPSSGLQFRLEIDSKCV